MHTFQLDFLHCRISIFISDANTSSIWRAVHVLKSTSFVFQFRGRLNELNCYRPPFVFLWNDAIDGIEFLYRVHSYACFPPITTGVYLCTTVKFQLTRRSIIRFHLGYIKICEPLLWMRFVRWLVFFE